jgi:hypothetical protein
LIELVAEVYWVDIVTLQVRKHNDLLFYIRQKPTNHEPPLQRVGKRTYEENHAEQQAGSHKNCEQKQPACRYRFVLLSVHGETPTMREIGIV